MAEGEEVLGAQYADVGYAHTYILKHEFWKDVTTKDKAIKSRVRFARISINRL